MRSRRRASNRVVGGVQDCQPAVRTEGVAHVDVVRIAGQRLDYFAVADHRYQFAVVRSIDQGAVVKPSAAEAHAVAINGQCRNEDNRPSASAVGAARGRWVRAGRSGLRRARPERRRPSAAEPVRPHPCTQSEAAVWRNDPADVPATRENPVRSAPARRRRPCHPCRRRLRREPPAREASADLTGAGTARRDANRVALS